jgi:hypothetical protein
MKKLTIIFLSAVILSLPAIAQRRMTGSEFEQFKSQKIAFITEKLNLTPKEAQAFWPVYNQYEIEKDGYSGKTTRT